MSIVITRFAPSPTGVIHIGSVRTALFSWLLARQAGGKFLLRIEDTDRARSSDEFTSLILETLDWLGLAPDAPPTFQSDRTEIYCQRAEQLVAKGKAYYCICDRERLSKLRQSQERQGVKPRYDRHCRELGIMPDDNTEAVIRFKNPTEGEVVVEDLVQGRVTYQNSELDDLIIIRSDGSPTYNFSVVVDELEMGITHVLRGDDHLNNTPRQINLYRAFGAELPQFGHVPMILSADGKKISKRDNPPSVLEYRDRGYMPEAILNYLVRLGWSHGDAEIFSVAEMVELFDVRRVHRSPASLDEKKLEWLNHQHIMSGEAGRVVELVAAEFAKRGIDTEASGPDLFDLVEVQRARAKTIVELVDRSLYFYQDVHEFEESAAKKHFKAAAVPLMQQLIEDLDRVEIWSQDSIHGVLSKIVERNEVGFGAVAQPVRVALTGGTISPGIDVTIKLVGRDMATRRLRRALEWINGSM